MCGGSPLPECASLRRSGRTTLCKRDPLTRLRHAAGAKERWRQEIVSLAPEMLCVVEPDGRDVGTGIALGKSGEEDMNTFRSIVLAAGIVAAVGVPNASAQIDTSIEF